MRNCLKSTIEFVLENFQFLTFEIYNEDIDGFIR